MQANATFAVCLLQLTMPVCVAAYPALFSLCTGNVLFDAHKHMLIMTGDKAIDWVKVEAGCPKRDMCYDSAQGAPQGQW